MEIVDILVTPFYLIVLLVIAWGYQVNNRGSFLVSQYFISSYFIRIAGGLAFAAIYVFYYGGGDTTNYHHDSLIISNALRNDFFAGINLLFFELDMTDPGTNHYVGKLIFRNDPAGYFIVRIAAIINIFTWDSFFSTTLFFSLIGYWGNWKLFTTMCRMFPGLHKSLAIGCLYLPSIIFWSSGIMKDTICSAAVCFLFVAAVEFFLFNKRSTLTVIIMAISCWILAVLKVYILLCFLPSLSIYIFSIVRMKIKNTFFKKIAAPFFLVFAIAFSFFFVQFILKDDKKYNFQKIEETAKITAQYIGYVSLKSGGSFYSLGEIDFSLSKIPLLVLKSVNVTFYRPYLWEINNPLMLFSALEGLYFLYLSFLFIKQAFTRRLAKLTAFTYFCFLFSISFAFVVGVTSSNFGTLARYKALMLPFFVCGIYSSIYRPVTLKNELQQRQTTFNKG